MSGLRIWWGCSCVRGSPCEGRARRSSSGVQGQALPVRPESGIRALPWGLVGGGNSTRARPALAFSTSYCLFMCASFQCLLLSCTALPSRLLRCYSGVSKPRQTFMTVCPVMNFHEKRKSFDFSERHNRRTDTTRSRASRAVGIKFGDADLCDDHRTGSESGTQKPTALG